MAKKTELNPETARFIADAFGKRPFERKGYDAKDNAQRNLSGISHYADSDTLKYFAARITQSGDTENGLIFYLVESSAKDFSRTTRGFRFAAFDLTGQCLNDRDAWYTSGEKAKAAFWEFMESFNTLEHYKTRLAEKAARLKRESENMAKAARQIRL